MGRIIGLQLDAPAEAPKNVTPVDAEPQSPVSAEEAKEPKKAPKKK